jgi:hypothetical protein
VPLFENIPRSHRWQYMASSQKLTRDVFCQLQGVSNLAEYSLLTARSVYSVHRQLHKMLALSEDDFRQPRLAISIDSKDPLANARLNPPWSTFLAGNHSFKEEVFKVESVRMARERAPLKYRLRSILSYQHDEILWLFARSLSSLAKRFTGRSALVVVGSHLVRDTAGHLALRGYSIEQFCQTPKELREIIFLDNLPTAPSSLAHEILEKVERIFQSFLDTWFHPAGHGPAKIVLNDTVERDIAEFYSAKLKWRSILSERTPSVILTRCPIAPIFMALGEAARDLGIPTAAAQHGVGREIDAINPIRAALLDNGVVDYFLAYNESARLVDEQSPFRRGVSLPIGLSADYFRVMRPALPNKTYPVIFVSTALLSGQVNNLKGGWVDIDRVQFELKLIKEVFAKLSYGVIYKQYPGTVRYPDPDIIQTAVRRTPNVHIFDYPVELVDMRLTQYQVILCARATSSVAWCLMADRPLAIIDTPEESPLRDDVKNMLEEAVFLFREDDPDLIPQLTEFLARPFADITAEWQAKAAARARLLEHFISGKGRGAGKRGAKILDKLISGC